MNITYKNLTHKRIYRNFVLLSPFKFSNDFLSAAYLLSADRDLWFKAKRAMQGSEIDFDGIDDHELSGYAYTLLKLAQDIYEGTRHLDLKDLCTPYVISRKTFVLFVEAIEICREGYKALGITKRFE
ncbi:MAG: hypothetical protein K5647_05230 [Clostridiales bacterium]|nr:hypothetical protein [Clostridiales bacterium]